MEGGLIVLNFQISTRPDPGDLALAGTNFWVLFAYFIIIIIKWDSGVIFKMGILGDQVNRIW